jgi:hypothetical protein
LLGFAQAFLLAGSRSVCLSLWEVDDSATVLLMDRFYRNMLGKREDGAKPMGKAAALQEAKQWLRGLSVNDALDRLGLLANGVLRGERPAREEMRPIPQPKNADKDYKPYAHPRYWAAFILIGDSEIEAALPGLKVDRSDSGADFPAKLQSPNYPDQLPNIHSGHSWIWISAVVMAVMVAVGGAISRVRRRRAGRWRRQGENWPPRQGVPKT